MVWYLLLDQVVGDGILASVAPAVVLFTVLSPAKLVEEMFFRGFLLNGFWRTTCFWKGNLASSSPFAFVHFPGWFALDNTIPLVATDVLGLLVFGIFFGWAMKRTGSL
jgi:membrane protease YdiL (CAAX protease family)